MSWKAPPPDKSMSASQQRRTRAQIQEEETAALLGPEWKERYGRITLKDGKKVSIRLLARQFIRFVPIYDISQSALEDLARQIKIQINDMKGGKRSKQRGAGFNEVLQVAKAVSLYAALKTSDATGRSAQYFKNEVIDPIFGSGSRLAVIIIKLGDQLFVKAPVTVTIGAIAAVGFTANVAATIVSKFNTWARGVAAAGLTDEVAESAAKVAVGDFKSIANTASIGFLVANQLGFLPFSSLAAAILYGLKVTATNAPLRANAVAMLYAWYLAMPDENRAEFNQKVREYTQQAKESAASAAAAAVPAAKELGTMLLTKARENPQITVATVTAAAAAIGVALNPGVAEAIVAKITEALTATGGRLAEINAFQAIAATAVGSIGVATAAPLLSAAEDPDAANVAAEILQGGAPAAAIAAADVGVFGAELEAAVAAMGAAGEGADVMPQGGRRPRKTKKRAMKKRRMTRRKPLTFSY